MKTLTRRSFLTFSSRLTALMGLAGSQVPAMAEALAQLSSGQAPVLWLQGQSCSGCSVSLLNSDPLSPDQLLTQYISLVFHQTLSAATGHQAVATVNQVIEKGGYILAVEGSVPAGMPRACLFGEEPFTQQVIRAARNAKAVVAMGSCAAFGGLPAAANNPTGAISIHKHLANEKVQVPCLTVPGCPPHPDWMVGTLAHVLKFGIPPVDNLGRPKAFFARKIHDQCPRFADYERENFAQTFGGEGCLFKLGCVGTNTYADCTWRPWNSGVNHCVKAGAPCVGCAGAQFGARADFPFFLKNTQLRKA
jgi:hydrogenase small subunit